MAKNEENLRVASGRARAFSTSVAKVKPLASERGDKRKGKKRETTMFRKLILCTVAVAGIVAPLTVAPAAQANGIHHRFGIEVLYRDPCNPCWVLAGRFHSVREAERVAASYRCRGFAVTLR
jgi:hypothetical protein